MIAPSQDLDFIDREAVSQYQQKKLIRRINTIILARLPQTQAQLFTLNWKDGMSITDIAHETHHSRKFVREQIEKATKTIRRIIEEEK